MKKFPVRDHAGGLVDVELQVPKTHGTSSIATPGMLIMWPRGPESNFISLPQEQSRTLRSIWRARLLLEAQSRQPIPP